MKTIISNYGEIASKDDHKNFSQMETLSNTNEKINCLKSEASEYLKGKLRFHKSKLEEEKRREYDRLSEEKKELTRKIKTYTLKERYLDAKKSPQTLIQEIENNIEIVEKKEKIRPIKMQYVGHLKRWLDLVLT